MSSPDEEPDHTDAGRGRDVGSDGYPEEQPAEANPGTPDNPGGGPSPDAPETDKGQDSDPQKSTGNPGAAG